MDLSFLDIKSSLPVSLVSVVESMTPSANEIKPLLQFYENNPDYSVCFKLGLGLFITHDPSMIPEPDLCFIVLDNRDADRVHTVESVQNRISVCLLYKLQLMDIPCE